ncbi:MAG: TetR/AcrR family transcriptional regulator, partial [Devosia sp.]|nr:TetR/AcrR family transcriptional regulator [Devosia sp.]
MSMPIAPVKRESGDDRKVAIALAARALIVEKGMEGLRTRDIADRVGINIATLHYHVPS